MPTLFFVLLFSCYNDSCIVNIKYMKYKNKNVEKNIYLIRIYYIGYIMKIGIE